MDSSKQRALPKFRFKFSARTLTYEGLYCELLSDFSNGNLPLKDDTGFGLKDEDKLEGRMKNRGPWYLLSEEIFNKVEKKRSVFSKLAYCYIYSKAKVKYIELMKEALKINRQPKDLVKLYIKKCADKQVNASMQKVFKIGKAIPTSSKRMGLLQSLAGLKIGNLTKVRKSVVRRSSNSIKDEYVNLENAEKERRMKDAMKDHSTIYIKVKDFDNHNLSKKKKVIFKGKYCNTYLFEDDEIFLRTSHLYKKFTPKSLSMNKQPTNLNSFAYHTLTLSSPSNNPKLSTPKFDSLTDTKTSKFNDKNLKFFNFSPVGGECKDYITNKGLKIITTNNEKTSIKSDILTLEKRYGITNKIGLKNDNFKEDPKYKSLSKVGINKLRSLAKSKENKSVSYFNMLDKSDFYFTNK